VCYASLFHAKSFCERIRTAIAHSRRCPLSRHDLAIPGLHPDPSSKAATLQRTNEDMRTRISTLKNALHSERTRNTETHREKVSRGDAPPPSARPPPSHTLLCSSLVHAFFHTHHTLRLSIWNGIPFHPHSSSERVRAAMLTKQRTRTFYLQSQPITHALQGTSIATHHTRTALRSNRNSSHTYCTASLRRDSGR
jgi:hypothetical protein